MGKQEKERGSEVGKGREQVQRGAFRKDAPATVSQDQLCGCRKREEFISNFSNLSATGSRAYQNED